MKKVFRDSRQVEIVFTDEGITFSGTEQEIFMPYGCINEVSISLLGVMQATSGKRICSFVVDRKDRAELKEMIRFARNAMKTAPKAELQIIDLKKKDEEALVSEDLPAEEQLRQYKALFIQGVISKEEYDSRKRRLKEV